MLSEFSPVHAGPALLQLTLHLSASFFWGHFFPVLGDGDGAAGDGAAAAAGAGGEAGDGAEPGANDFNVRYQAIII